MNKILITITLLLLFYMGVNWHPVEKVTTPSAPIATAIIPIDSKDVGRLAVETPVVDILWICSNDESVIYMMVSNKNNFIIFSDNGAEVGRGRFSLEKTDEGKSFLYAEIGSTAIAAARTSESTVAVMFIKLNEPGIKFDCQ